MSVRVHCDICAGSFDPETPMAVLAVPDETGPGPKSPLESFLSERRPAEIQKHFCLACARTLLQLLVAHLSELRGIR